MKLPRKHLRRVPAVISLLRKGNGMLQPFQYFPSSSRYWIASATCVVPMVSAPSMSAIVRATFTTRPYARILMPMRSTAMCRSDVASGVIGQYFLLNVY